MCRTTRSTTRATRRSPPRRAHAQFVPARPTGPAAGGGRRTRRKSAASIARSRPAASSPSFTPSSETTPMTSAAVKLDAAAAEVALGEAQAVLALVQDAERRGRLADLVAAVQDGELGDDEAQALEELIELGLSTGRIRGIYGTQRRKAGR